MDSKQSDFCSFSERFFKLLMTMLIEQAYPPLSAKEITEALAAACLVIHGSPMSDHDMGLLLHAVEKLQVIHEFEKENRKLALNEQRNSEACLKITIDGESEWPNRADQ